MGKMKKFELTTEHKINWLGRTLYRIKACISFTTITGDEIKAGDLGGYVEKESNLSQNGDAKVYGDADYISIKGLGSCYRFTTAFKDKKRGIAVSCGCFFGSLQEFKKVQLLL